MGEVGNPQILFYVNVISHKDCAGALAIMTALRSAAPKHNKKEETK